MNDRGIGSKSLNEFLASNPDHRVYDYSSLELADQCLRKYKYKYVDGLEDKVGIEAEFSKHLIHPVIGLAYTMTYEQFHDMRARSTFWSPHWKRFQESGARPVTMKQEMYKLELAQRLVNQFCGAYSGDFLMYELVAVEQLYWRILPALKNAVWVAKPDLMLRRRGDGHELTAEIKVSSWPFNSGLNAMDRQILSQAWATGVPLQMKIFLQIGLGREPEHQAQREIKPPDEQLLTEWLDEVQFSVGVLQDAYKSDIWPKRAPRSCTDFNKPCQYLDVCPLSSNRTIILDTMPKANPLEYLDLAERPQL